MAAAKKPNAMSLHIGLNAVSAAAYGGWDGPLAACEFDAKDMATLARGKGMTATTLLTKKATRNATLTAMRRASRTLKSGDFFFLTYSGHGGQVPDTNGDEADRRDETWCLYDGQLIDDELYFELGKFAAGVRVLVFSDSCHSGTVTRDRLPPPPPPGTRLKLMPEPVARRTYEEHKAFYDRLQADVAKAAGSKPVDPDHALAQLSGTGGAASATALVGAFKASVLLISGCQDNQTSLDGDHNGAFTEQLLKVWNHGNFKGSYALMHARIKAAMPASQTPNLFTLGPAAAFIAQQPFTV